MCRMRIHLSIFVYCFKTLTDIEALILHPEHFQFLFIVSLMFTAGFKYDRTFAFNFCLLFRNTWRNGEPSTAFSLSIFVYCFTTVLQKITYSLRYTFQFLFIVSICCGWIHAEDHWDFQFLFIVSVLWVPVSWAVISSFNFCLLFLERSQCVVSGPMAFNFCLLFPLGLKYLRL